jgi:hypothetical protein
MESIDARRRFMDAPAVKHWLPHLEYLQRLADRRKEPAPDIFDAAYWIERKRNQWRPAECPADEREREADAGDWKFLQGRMAAAIHKGS